MLDTIPQIPPEELKPRIVRLYRTYTGEKGRTRGAIEWIASRVEGGPIPRSISRYFSGDRDPSKSLEGIRLLLTIRKLEDAAGLPDNLNGEEA